VRLVALGAGLLTLAIIVLYGKDYTTPPHHPTTHDPIRIGYTLLNFLSMSVGLIGGLALPPVPGLLACVAIGWGVARLLRQGVWSDPVTAGLLAWIGGLVLLAAGTAYGRAGFAGAAGIACRYVTLTCLLAVWLHLLRQRTATPLPVAVAASDVAPHRPRRAGAVVVILGWLVANSLAGWHYARAWREWFAAVESRLANTPRSFVPDAFVWTLGGGDGRVFRRSVLRLVDWGVGPLANVPPDPRLRRLSVPTTQLWLDNVQRLGNTYRPRDQTGGRIVIPIPPGTTARGLLLLGQLTDGHCLVLNDAADTDPLESTTQPTEYRLWLSEAREAVWLELQHGQLAIERIILLVD
jgi:hypothetical protein